MNTLFEIAPDASTLMPVLAQSTGLKYLLRPDVVFWIFVAVVATVPMGLGLYFKTRSREEELRTIAELARAGHGTEEIERLIRKTNH